MLCSLLVRFRKVPNRERERETERERERERERDAGWGIELTYHSVQRHHLERERKKA